jgi:hypothetical protein
MVKWPLKETSAIEWLLVSINGRGSLVWMMRILNISTFLFHPATNLFVVVPDNLEGMVVHVLFDASLKASSIWRARIDDTRTNVDVVLI